MTRWRWLLLGLGCWLAACGHDWDLLDPALRGEGGSASQGPGGAGTGSATGLGAGGATGGQGGVGGLGGAGGGGGVFEDPWWDTGYARRRQLVLANTHDEEMVDFPVLVTLDATRIDYGVTQPDGADLRFVDADGTTELAYEIDTWDPAGTSAVWVRVPSIEASSTDDYIAMYYGNPAASDAQSATSVWSNAYLAVWHLSADLADVVSGYDGTNAGSIAAAGQIGAAREFDGVDDYVDIGSPAGLDGLFDGGAHVSAWVYTQGPGGNSYGRIIDRSLDNSSAGGWALMYSQFVAVDSFRFTRGHTLESGGWDTPAGALPADTWTYVAVSYDDSSLANLPALYVDGDQKGATPNEAPMGAPDVETGTPLRIGNTGSDTLRGWDGRIDEVRISSQVRSNPWIDNQYRSMTDAMITFGSEQTAP